MFYLGQLMGFRNQLTVAPDWSFAYAYRRDMVRLDTRATESVEQGDAGVGENDKETAGTALKAS